MSEYLVEDTQTGFKFVVEGDGQPTEDEATSLMSEATSALAGKLHQLGGNRYMLDVGPLEGIRKVSDTADEMDALLSKMERSRYGYERGTKRAHEIYEAAGTNRVNMDYSAILAEQIKLADKEAETLYPRAKSTTETILSRLPANTLIVNAHGSEKGGLSTDEGVHFTLNNVAKLLGETAPAINNLYNLACYTGRLQPSDFQSAFPNLTNVIQGQTNAPNMISVDNLTKGKYFGGETTNVMRWIKRPDAVWERHDYQPSLPGEVSYGEPPQYQPEE